MRLTQQLDFLLLNTNDQLLPVRLFNNFLCRVLKVFVFMAEPDNTASARICQLQFIMVGVFLCREQISPQLKNSLSKINELRRKHNSFWQRGAGLASLARQKGLFLYSSANKQSECLDLAA